jgi:hypothetical protein
MEVPYMDYFKVLVKQENIAPSEVWKLDIPMVKSILSDQLTQPMDLTIMLNAERMQNGATREFINGN